MDKLSPDVVAALSPADRLALIEQLWESLGDADIPVTPAQAAELERRLATFDADKDEGVAWTQLRAELTQRRP